MVARGCSTVNPASGGRGRLAGDRGEGEAIATRRWWEIGGVVSPRNRRTSTIHDHRLVVPKCLRRHGEGPFGPAKIPGVSRTPRRRSMRMLPGTRTVPIVRDGPAHCSVVRPGCVDDPRASHAARGSPVRNGFEGSSAGTRSGEDARSVFGWQARVRTRRGRGVATRPGPARIPRCPDRSTPARWLPPRRSDPPQ